jgi:hypothetical protein
VTVPFRNTQFSARDYITSSGDVRCPSCSSEDVEVQLTTSTTERRPVQTTVNDFGVRVLAYDATSRSGHTRATRRRLQCLNASCELVTDMQAGDLLLVV